MLTLHPNAAIEYWYFKVNAGPIALIVDWIARRKLNENWLRVSVHSPYKREVIFERLATFMPNDNFLNNQKTVGHAGEVTWDLDIVPGNDWIQPDIFPAVLLKMPDTIYKSAPMATFNGWIRHGNQQVKVDHVPGSLTQYWGRQLYSEWWWVSTHQFDQEGVALECSVAHTSLWGTAAQMPTAFLYLRQKHERIYTVAPMKRANAAGTPEKFQLEFNRAGKEKITLVGTGRDYGDFGEGITNTLVGDLEVYEGSRLVARAHGTAGLERRMPDR